MSPKQGKYDGSRLSRTRPKVYRQIIELLARGQSAMKIARELRVSRRSVAAVLSEHQTTITQRKTNLATVAARVAQASIEQIEDELAEGKLKGSALVPVFGVAVDKLLLLSGEPTERIEHVQRGNIFLRFQAFHEDVRKVIKAHEVQPALPTSQNPQDAPDVARNVADASRDNLPDASKSPQESTTKSTDWRRM